MSLIRSRGNVLGLATRLAALARAEPNSVYGRLRPDVRQSVAAILARLHPGHLRDPELRALLSIREQEFPTEFR